MADTQPESLSGASSTETLRVSNSSERYVALLRGVNVGGKNRVSMRDLVALFEELGCQDIDTYIQSGNVVFGSDPELVASLPARLEALLGERLGLKVPVVLRSSEKLAIAVDRNPFLLQGADPTALHVMFLSDLPAPELVAALDPGRSPPDAFVVHGSEIYLHCPNGLARSKLTVDYFDSKLAVTSTVRNWRTVLTLRDRARR